MAMPNAKILLGNHEFMMLIALGEPYDVKCRNISDSCELWYRNGGSVTHLAKKQSNADRLLTFSGYRQYIKAGYATSKNSIFFRNAHIGIAERRKMWYNHSKKY